MIYIFVDVSCAAPVAMDHVFQSSDVVVSPDYLVYTCGQGYRHMEGDLVRQCLANGTLSGTAPVCGCCSSKYRSLIVFTFYICKVKLLFNNYFKLKLN